MKIVLASQSISRARLLEAADIPFEAQPARIDEDAVKRALLAEKRGADAIADALAELKALRVSNARPDDLVIGADQLLLFEGEILSKCANLDEARKLLLRLRGKSHELIGGLVLARAGAIIWRHLSRAKLRMRAFSDAFLDDYLSNEGETVLGSVGCYRLEGRGLSLFDQVDGDYFSILGLSLLPLLHALRNQGAIPS